MIFRLLCLIIFISHSICAQDATSTIIHGKKYKGIIFPKDYEMSDLGISNSESRFTPSIIEIIELEKYLQFDIKSINEERPNQGKYFGPIIERNLKKYVRQYYGYINKNGERIIHVNFLWDRSSLRESIGGYTKPSEGWEEDWKSVLDGGSRFWEIKYNLNKFEFFDFLVNGIA